MKHKIKLKKIGGLFSYELQLNYDYLKRKNKIINIIIYNIQTHTHSIHFEKTLHFSVFLYLENKLKEK